MSLLTKDRAILRVTQLVLLLGIATWIGAFHLRQEDVAYDEPPSPARLITSNSNVVSTFTNAAQADQLSPDQLAESNNVSGTIMDRSPVEQWILEQVENGQSANLNDRFPNEADRVVDAAFIKSLLTGKPGTDKVDTYGVHISNAKIVGNLNLINHEIRHDTSLTECVFEDDVLLHRARFLGNLNLHGTSFRKRADFRYLGIGSSLSLERAVFNGWTNFYRLNIVSNLLADYAKFNETQEGVNFEAMTVGGYAFFRHAVFQGAARFYGASVSDNFEADNAVFSETSKATDFENMRIDANALFRNTTFNGPVRFQRTTVGKSLETGNNVVGARFKSEVDFTNVTADAIGFHPTDFSGPIVLRGLKYQRLSTGSPKDLLWMLNRSEYDSSSYAELEQYCRRIGDLDNADEVYIHKRRRERAQLSTLPWVGNWLLDRLVGYGRRPWRTLIWSTIIVVGAACLIFRKNKMQARNPADKTKPYSAFLYSLDLLLPIVDLQSVSAWTPKRESHLARRYLPVHVIAGWVLVTILAATLTGILK